MHGYALGEKMQGREVMFLALQEDMLPSAVHQFPWGSSNELIECIRICALKFTSSKGFEINC